MESASTYMGAKGNICEVEIIDEQEGLVIFLSTPRPELDPLSRGIRNDRLSASKKTEIKEKAIHKES